jgi:hypothetical protein
MVHPWPGGVKVEGVVARAGECHPPGTSNDVARVVEDLEAEAA